jgi:hypothetical protein
MVKLPGNYDTLPTSNDCFLDVLNIPSLFTVMQSLGHPYSPEVYT